MTTSTTTRRRARVVVPVVATALILVPLAYLWVASWVPGRYSVMSMGYDDFGGGARVGSPSSGGMRHGAGAIDVRTLVPDPSRKADVTAELTADQATFPVGGQSIKGFTLNHRSPGPAITATVGQLVEVRLHNNSVSGGVSLHWHGLDVPNAEDGVAGVTQDMVAVGRSFTYRFVATRAGSYWYHSHQVSDAQVTGGLFGALVVRPRAAAEPVDVTALAHTYGGTKTLNGRPGDLVVPAQPGQAVRVRVINSDDGPIETWTGAPVRVLATDGHDVHAPGLVGDHSVTVTAGGRIDLGLTMPADGSALRVQVSRGTAVILGSGAPPDVPTQPATSLDLLNYGSPTAIGFDPAAATRHFDYSIGHRPGFVRGVPGLWWSINGHLYPDVPMYVVREGDVVVMHIDNHSGEVHPMHLHGHHAVVLSRNGVAATGSPWWVDSLNVLDRETYDIAFVADNPGIWMDHCHNLKHAAQGMVAHLMYEGYTTPFQIGDDTRNVPE